MPDEAPLEAPDAVLRHQVTVDAPPETTWQALVGTDLLEVPVHRVIDDLATIPRKLALMVQGRKPLDATAEPVRRLTLADLVDGGPFVELASTPPDELVIGAMGRAWGADPGLKVVQASRFAARQAPDHVKLVLAFHLTERATQRTRLEVELRLAGTDRQARRRVETGWRLLRWPVGWWLGRCLALVRDNAEGASTRTPARGAFDRRGADHTVPE